MRAAEMVLSHSQPLSGPDRDLLGGSDGERLKSAIDLKSMSEAILTIDDAARRLADVVEQIHTTGDSAVLVKSGQPIARIVPVAPSREVSQGLVAFLAQWRLEYPEPDEQFSDAIQESRQWLCPPRHQPD
jgi:prevent-host-death family protein